MATSKTKPTMLSVATFLDGVADTRKRDDAKALIEMMQEATGDEPVMWGRSIVGFGSYRYKYESGRKSALVVYILTGFQGSEALLEKLGKHTTGKSCLYVRRLADVDARILRQLVAGSVAAMRAKYPG